MGPRYRFREEEKMKDTDFDQQGDYQEKRARNNVAVKKSREKTRQKQRETVEKVNRLRQENQDLEMKVTLLSKELQVLRNLFLEHAGVAGLPSSVSDTCGEHCSVVNSQKKTVVKAESDTLSRVDAPQSNSFEMEAVHFVNEIAAKVDHEYSTKSYSTLS